MFSHYFGVFWRRPDAAATLPNAPQLPKLHGIWLLSNLASDHPFFGAGLFGVALFFLISGFVIPFSFRTQSRTGFAIARVLRLWPTYIVRLTLSLSAGGLASGFFHRSFPYSWTTVFANYALGFRDIFWKPSADGIVWTLEIEVRFYLLCVIIAPWLRRGRPKAVIAALVVDIVLSGIGNFLWANMSLVGGHGMGGVYAVSLDGQMNGFMCLGTLLHMMMRYALSRFAHVITSVGAWIAFYFLWKTGITAPQFNFGFWSFAVAYCVFLIAYLCRNRFAGGAFLNWLGDIRYSLYVTHAVVGYVIIRIGVALGLSPAICVCVALMWAFGSASLVHRYVELPTRELGRRLSRRTMMREGLVSAE